MRAMAVGMAALLAGCSQPQNNSVQNAQVAALEIRADSAQHVIQGLLEDDKALRSRIEALESARSDGLARVAMIDPAAGSSYQVVETNVAPVLVSFSSSAPVGDGTRVYLQLGNLSSATFVGASVDLTYNKRIPQSGDAIAAWNEAMRSATVKIADNIKPGTWNTVNVSLPGIKPDELGFLTVKVSLDTVSLRPY